MELLLVRVARYLDDLHPVQEGGRDGGHTVSCSNEQHLREVKWNIQVAEVMGQGDNVHHPIKLDIH